MPSIKDIIPESSFTINLNAGAQGKQGIQGPVGETPNIQIGEVVKGIEASATISGTKEEPKLNLVLPKGDTGNSISNIESLNGELIVTIENEGSTNLGQIVPKIEVGEVKTLNPNETVKFENVGTGLNPIFNVAIPKGERGEAGPIGPAGQIKFIIVNELPTENIDKSAIYMKKLTEEEKQKYETDDDYREYIWVDEKEAFEPLGTAKVDVDLKDYVKNTDYATSTKGGVIKVNATYGNGKLNDGTLVASTNTYASYNTMSNSAFIGKGTLENVITGKGLVSNGDYASSSTGGVIKTSVYDYGLDVSNGFLLPNSIPYSTYETKSNNYAISKGTLENVLEGKGIIDSNEVTY